LRPIVRRELEPIVDDIQVDAMGNLIAVKKKAGAPKLMIAAHMDEIGFIVSYIDEQRGWLRLVGLGSHDPRNMQAQRVTVSTPDGDLNGVLYPGIKPPHLQTAEDKKNVLKISDFIVDLGMPAQRVMEQVPIGSFVTMQREFTEIGDCVSCKALDDRAALYIMIEAMKQAQSWGFEVYAVATVQEEIGLRGAMTSAYGVAPDVGIAIDATVAADIPSVPQHEWVTQVGEGVAIKIMDQSVICDSRLVIGLRSLADARGIQWQNEILPRGGTDAGTMHRVRSGVPCAAISIPTRYIHTSIEMVSKSDIMANVALMTAFIEEGDQIDLTRA